MINRVLDVLEFMKASLVFFTVIVMITGALGALFPAVETLLPIGFDSARALIGIPVSLVLAAFLNRATAPSAP